MGATGDLLFASIVVSDEESGPRGRDLLIAEPSTEKECPRRLVRTDYRANLRGHSFSVLGSAIRRSRPLGPDSSSETTIDAKRRSPVAPMLNRVHRSRLHISVAHS